MELRLYINGNLMGMPDSLMIIQFESDEGYYLYYLDKDGEKMNDTYHDSLQDARADAERAYCVRSSEWIFNE